MEIPLNLAIIGEQKDCPVQIIARARSTVNNAPNVQVTTTKLEDETEHDYINRLRSNLRKLIAPFGYAHHIVLLCRYEAHNDIIANDTFQNLSARLSQVAKNSDNHMERVKALSIHYDLILGFESLQS